MKLTKRPKLNKKLRKNLMRAQGLLEKVQAMEQQSSLTAENPEIQEVVKS